jgi:spermidine/putrescine transport system permease protein
MNTHDRFRFLSIGGGMVWLAVFGLLPGLLMLGTSFLARHEAELIEVRFSLEGYRTIIDPIFLKILGNSLYLAVGTTLICLLAAYPFAYALARMGNRCKRVLLMLVMIPFWTNSLVRTYALVFMLKTKGVISALLVWLGVTPRPVSFMYTEAAVFIGLTYTLLPFMILPLYTAIEKMDGKLVEAARDLGAGSWRTFFHVTLPLTMPGIVAGCMMVFLPALGMFFVPDMLGGGKHLLVGNFIQNQFLVARDWPAGAAAGVVLTLLMLALMYMQGISRGRAGKKRGARP